MGIQQPSHFTPLRRLLALSIATALCIAPITQASAADEISSLEVKDKLTGALFVVVKDDKVLLNKGYGYADLEKEQPIDPNKTAFRMASVSKVFTATGVMQLFEEG